MRSNDCGTADALHPGWNDIGSYTALYKRRADGSYFTCSTSQLLYLEWVNNQVSSSATQHCGAGDYLTAGQHLYNSFSGPSSGYNADFWTLTPLAYNS